MPLWAAGRPYLLTCTDSAGNIYTMNLRRKCLSELVEVYGDGAWLDKCVIVANGIEDEPELAVETYPWLVRID